ncbi:MAG: caspase family protein [Methylococcales bacterium]
MGTIVYDWTKDGITTSKEVTLVEVRKKAAEIGVDGIYELTFNDNPVAAMGMSFVEFGLQAKAYICEDSSLLAKSSARTQDISVAVSGTDNTANSGNNVHAMAKTTQIMAPVPGESRTALVIGNSRYPQSPLRTPPNDARAMSAALKRLGFDVDLVENGNRRNMLEAIETFGRNLENRRGVGLVFYAGHGMQVKGHNYLIPIDASVSSDLAVVTETVDVDWVLGTMSESGTRVNVVILDACRDNPYERRFRGSGSGLAAMNADDARGTLIAYSTSPGKTAQDGSGSPSPYAQALIDTIETTGVTIEQVFKQVRIRVPNSTSGAQTPWETSNLTGEFVFR